MTRYSVLFFKATRGAKLLKAELQLEDAKRLASDYCDYARAFSIAELLAAGVALLVVADEYSVDIVNKGIIRLKHEKVMFQAGAY